MNRDADTQSSVIDVEFTDNVVPFHTEGRIALLRLRNQERRIQSIRDAAEDERKKHRRDWMSFDWDAADLVERK
jgi:hypothetical protein